MHTLGKKTGHEPGLSSIDAIELARVYDSLTTEECFSKETMKKYIRTLERIVTQSQLRCPETAQPEANGG